MKARSLTLALLCSALLAGAPAATAQAAEAASHGFLYEVHGFKGTSGTEAFEGPCGVAVDSAARVYVSDFYRDRILVFPTTGGVPSGEGGLPNPSVLAEEDPGGGPCGLAMSPSALYVNNYHQNVVRYPFAGETPNLAAGTVIDSASSTGVAFDRGSGQVFVDDRTYVGVYDESGAPVEVGGEPLRIGLGTLGEGYGVAVSEYPGTEGLVYVADASTGTVKVYNPAPSVTDPRDTNPVGEINGEATAEGGFWELVDAALAVSGNDGHIYLTHKPSAFYEHPEDLVDEFNSAGQYRGRILPGSLVDGEPTGIEIVPTGFTGAGNLLLTSGNGDAGKLLGLAPTGPAHLLTVGSQGAGSGDVTSQPAGIRCGGACTAEFNSGASVTLTATPAAGSVFSGWTVTGGGASCSGTGTCQVTLSADVEVIASFEPAPTAAAAAATAASGMAPTAAPAASGVQSPSGSVVRPLSRQTLVAGPRRQARRRHKARHHSRQAGHRQHRYARRPVK